MEENATKKDIQDIKDILVSIQGNQEATDMRIQAMSGYQEATDKRIQGISETMQVNQEATDKRIQGISEAMVGYQEANRRDIQDILETINAFASHTEDRFLNIDARFNAVDSRFNNVDLKLDQVENRLTSVESQMVTKAYLDDKLADLRGDLTGYDRKQDKKVDFLTKTLENKKYLSPKEAEAVVVMSPFPQAPKVV